MGPQGLSTPKTLVLPLFSASHEIMPRLPRAIRRASVEAEIPEV